MILQKDFYEQDTIVVAKQLLGCYFVHEIPELAVGKIVETEAYIEGDPANHAYKGITPRNKPMFGQSGNAYIYFIYGKYYCFNVVTGKVGKGEAVLIRALEPVTGISIMKSRRHQDNLYKLCNGPANLVQAMGIPKEYNGRSITDRPLYIVKKSFTKQEKIQSSVRIGISNEEARSLPLRFYSASSRFVSNIP